MRFLARDIRKKGEGNRLSLKDKKTLQLLVEDARMPITVIARKVGVSKSAIVQKIVSLNHRGFLIGPVLLAHPRTYALPLYVYEISTLLGVGDEKTTAALNRLDSLVSVFWYNGPYNLVLVFHTDDSQKTLDAIAAVVPIKKLRVRRVVDGWFHPSHLFAELPPPTASFARTKPLIDSSDAILVHALENNPLASLTELSAATSMAPQTVRKRFGALKRSGAILSCNYFPDVWACGKEILSVNLAVRGRKDVERILKHLFTIPYVSNIWEYDDEWNIGFILWMDDQFAVFELVNHLLNRFAIMEYDISVLVAFVGK